MKIFYMLLLPLKCEIKYILLQHLPLSFYNPFSLGVGVKTWKGESIGFDLQEYWIGWNSHFAYQGLLKILNNFRLAYFPR